MAALSLSTSHFTTQAISNHNIHTTQPLHFIFFGAFPTSPMIVPSPNPISATSNTNHPLLISPLHQPFIHNISSLPRPFSALRTLISATPTYNHTCTVILPSRPVPLHIPTSESRQWMNRSPIQEGHLTYGRVWSSMWTWLGRWEV